MRGVRCFSTSVSSYQNLKTKVVEFHKFPFVKQVQTIVDVNNFCQDPEFSAHEKQSLKVGSECQCNSAVSSVAGMSVAHLVGFIWPPALFITVPFWMASIMDYRMTKKLVDATK